MVDQLPWDQNLLKTVLSLTTFFELTTPIAYTIVSEMSLASDTLAVVKKNELALKQGFFSRFSADFGKFIFRYLEFREKSLSLAEKSLSLENKIVEFG